MGAGKLTARCAGAVRGLLELIVDAAEIAREHELVQLLLRLQQLSCAGSQRNVDQMHTQTRGHGSRQGGRPANRQKLRRGSPLILSCSVCSEASWSLCTCFSLRSS